MDCEILGCLGNKQTDASLLGGQPVNLTMKAAREAHTDLLLCLLGLYPKGPSVKVSVADLTALIRSSLNAPNKG